MSGFGWLLVIFGEVVLGLGLKLTRNILVELVLQAMDYLSYNF